MLPTLVLAALFASAPSPASPDSGAEPPTPTPDAAIAVEAKVEVKSAKPPKPPKPSPEERLAMMDKKRIALNMGVRGYGRFLGPTDSSYGAAVELGLGVRLVRGLYIQTEVDAGAHALPFGAQGRAFVGLRHEFRMAPWIRPELSLGYNHAFEVAFDGYADVGCNPCKSEPQWGFGFDGGTEIEFASRNGVEAGLGVRVPFKRAPRLSLYLRGDATYYFDDRPGRLQAGGSLGFSIVF